MNISRFRSIFYHYKHIPVIIKDTHGSNPFKNNIRTLAVRPYSENRRSVSTLEVDDNSINRPSKLKQLLKFIPFFNIDNVKIKSSAYLLYENIADKLDYIQIFEKYELADTFYSWFVITELHIWMLSVRAMAEGDDGQLLRNALVEALWQDVAKRTKKLGEYNPASLREQIKELSEQLQAAFISYDEGLQSDDITLANALWRRMYQRKYASPYNISEMVRYIRKHISDLDNLSKEQILSVEPVKWRNL